ncbi:hypothetical protein CEXT_479751 [Caerostris extrusa]|uniref:Uncharacterized protein n=1 Tax=Caerostris extrusa TaxID=172846 RepID=A0AAV4XRW2_CAEEX|nr:hypothetical protein CEXT_479751 [Caerostris extrusa]
MSPTSLSEDCHTDELNSRVPSGIENDIGPRKNSNYPKNGRRTAFWGIIPDADDNESLRSNCQTIIRPSGLKRSKFNTWFTSVVIFGLCFPGEIFCGYQMASHGMSFTKCAIWDSEQYWSAKNSKNDPKNGRRTAFWGIIPDAADNESLRSNCQTIIRPPGLKRSKFNTCVPSWIENDIGPQKTPKNDPKNGHRKTDPAFWGIISEADDNESLPSNCQTIIRPSRLKRSKFNTWFASL